MALTRKNHVFISEYIKSFNGADAARRAGYSEKTAYSIASKLLRNVDISDEIKRRIDEVAMSANEVLLRLAEQARSSQKPFIRITDDGFVYFDFSHPDAKDNLHLIKKLKSKRTRRVDGPIDDKTEYEDEWVEVELYDAQAALALLGRYHGLFTDKVDLSSKGKELATVNVYIPSNGRD